MTSLYEEIQEVRARYPEGSRSAVLPALRLAQERDGWLSRATLEEVADALEVTPAFCYSIATFYDMLHLEPVGRHTIDVCTNLPCALCGAQQVVEAFESELGIRAGETTPDGEITLRAVECLGGCGYATVVAVNDRYRQHVRPETAPEILQEIAGLDG
jgi:NADH-quinone oxidoreductase E subunit